MSTNAKMTAFGIVLLALGCGPATPAPTPAPHADASGSSAPAQASSSAAAAAPASTLAGSFAPDKRPAVGARHSCAIKADGSLWCWGVNGGGQLGDGTTDRRSTPVPVSGMGAGVVAVSTGEWHTCAVGSSGSLSCWGANSAGQLGDGTTEERSTPALVSGMGADVVAVSARASHSCAVKRDGSLWCWGANSRGELGDGTLDTKKEPVAVRDMASGVTAVAVGPLATCAIKAGGSLWCWGAFVDPSSGGYSAKGLRRSADAALTPVAVPGMEAGVEAVVVGAGYNASHTCALKGGQAWCWGDFTDSFASVRSHSETPLAMAALGAEVVAIAASGGYRGSQACAVKGDGSVWCWGSNSSGQLGDGTRRYRRAPVAVLGMQSDAASVEVADDHTCAVKKDGTTWCWGMNEDGELGVGSDGQDKLAATTVSGLGADIATASLRDGYACATKRDGSVWCWGDPGQRVTGDSPMLTLRPLPGVSARRLVLGRGRYACAIAQDESLSCWGSNSHGQLGDGTQRDRDAPAAVSGMASGVRAVATGPAFACAAKTDGSLWCWGANWSGQLGDGTTTTRNAPVAVRGLASVTKVAVGTDHVCALADGAVWCWGGNSRGELGDGTTTGRKVPTKVAALADVIDVAAGEAMSCAVKRDGSLWCWGRSLPDGSEDADEKNNPRPVAVMTAGVVGVALGSEHYAGDGHACALVSDGGVSCWGANVKGQLGNGSKDASAVPVPVAGMSSGAVAVWVGFGRSYALRSDGSLWGWGDNCDGCLLADGNAWKAVAVEVR